MFQWLAENVGGVRAIISIIGILLVYILKAMHNAGWIGRKSLDVVAGTIEDTEGVVTRLDKILAEKRKTKDFLSDAEIAEATLKALKGEIRERSIKEGGKRVFNMIAQSAMDADPDKSKPTTAMKIKNLLPLIGG